MGSDEMIEKSVISDKLRHAGLRPTRQRIALAQLLFGQGDRHLCAETLHREALAIDIRVSMATIYNTLNQFTEAGLLRALAIEGTRSFYDTNVSNHFHYYDEAIGHLFDIGTDHLTVQGLPPLPEGMEINRIDVIVRIAKKTAPI